MNDLPLTETLARVWHEQATGWARIFGLVTRAWLSRSSSRVGSDSRIWMRYGRAAKEIISIARPWPGWTWTLVDHGKFSCSQLCAACAEAPTRSNLPRVWFKLGSTECLGRGCSRLCGALVRLT